MSDEEFIVLFTEAIGADLGSITLDTTLSDSGSWDSVAYLSVMALVDERMGVALDPELLVDAVTPRAILEQARLG